MKTTEPTKTVRVERSRSVPLLRPIPRMKTMAKTITLRAVYYVDREPQEGAKPT